MESEGKPGTEARSYSLRKKVKLPKKAPSEPNLSQHRAGNPQKLVSWAAVKAQYTKDIQSLGKVKITTQASK